MLKLDPLHARHAFYLLSRSHIGTETPSSISTQNDKSDVRVNIIFHLMNTSGNTVYLVSCFLSASHYGTKSSFIFNPVYVRMIQDIERMRYSDKLIVTKHTHLVYSECLFRLVVFVMAPLNLTCPHCLRHFSSLNSSSIYVGHIVMFVLKTKQKLLSST